MALAFFPSVSVLGRTQLAPRQALRAAAAGRCAQVRPAEA